MSSSSDRLAAAFPGDATILLVDPDGVSRRFVEIALRDGAPTRGTKSGLVLETAKDAASGIEMLHSTRVDLVLAETELPDMNGLAFFRCLRQESRLRGLPFVFLSSDKRVTTKVVALRAGVDDYLGKPCDAAELAARVSALVQRQRRAHIAQGQRAYTLAGDFSTLPFPDLMSILEVSRRTGCLSVASPRSIGDVTILDGQVIHAVFANLTGLQAFHAIMADGRGQFEFSTRPVDPRAPRTIDASVAALLIEGARLLDESGASQGHAPAPSLRPLGPRSSLPPGPVALEGPAPALRPSRALASQFELGVGDGFAVAELHLFTADELARWTRAPGGRSRLHVHLIAEPSAAVSSMLAIAGQPTERWVLSALTAEPKAFGLAFFLRQEHLLDVVLVDIRDPAAFERSLCRSPSLVVLAPPDGDYLAIGTTAVFKLEVLLQRVGALALLGVGNASFATALKGLAAVRSGAVSSAFRSGALGDGQTDLRSLLVDGIRLWSSAVTRAPSSPAGRLASASERGRS